MGKGLESLIYLMLFWGMPAFMGVRAYLKMNPEDKKSAMSDFKSHRFIFTLGFITIGGFVSHVGFLFSIRAIEVLGIILFISGGIITVISMWKDSKVRSFSILVVISFPIFLYYYW
ncbi:hypothetical protein KQ939_00020 [Planococcus sp. CP5-4]|uniref:hypothetical protein n=1 Tax=unclassified Planococcus (in: firmicutes) TaxID=2662419 RepID=UPI001C23204C|nr:MULTISPECIES: hypothetical protein [unclassified Planococcus (in: firmicutes)]MBU9675191.1 hypothetical protein [Planococcus sp. CP5-4_YE]MBV0910703.1 hypothetical protein [Planococcus sp. CP5-4_UN]MBW6062086.1 hypothetical protein [Planococcus sp. CP5-4]